MAATKTQAFVLKTQDYRDTSLLAYFYTRDYGKIHGIIRGIRDGRERYGSTLEPFSLNEILFYRRRRGGDLHQVTQVELLEPFFGVREDLERVSYASYFVDLLNQLVEVEDPHPPIFDLLSDLLWFLQTGASCRRGARIYEIKLFELLGFMPEIRSCVACRTPSPDPAYFDTALGGILCGHCRSSRDGASLSLSKGTLHFLDHVRNSAVRDLLGVKVSEGVGKELERVLRRFVDFYLSNKLKSVVFLEKMGF
ncbi:MAG: DNA repair protein RecO [Candidatus Omnitrophica bacterium]|nr:DNA repair protein RecO [Candidatus Omnitrophota bacterium]